MKIRPCELSDQAPDVAAITDIYNHYITHTTITFEEQVIATDQMRTRIEAYTRLYPWLVAVDEAGTVQGYAYASKWKERAAYRHTAEATIYLRHGAEGQGLGKALYGELLKQIRQQGCHVVLGCIAIPNDASIGLHEHLGFKKVAHFNEVGRKFDQWLDVGYWQLQLG
jgi:L-amino acid N-acyltransferase YncA